MFCIFTPLTFSSQTCEKVRRLLWHGKRAGHSGEHYACLVGLGNVLLAVTLGAEPNDRVLVPSLRGLGTGIRNGCLCQFRYEV